MSNEQRLKCHVVNCENECINVGPGSETDPYDLEYFCDTHHKEFGRVPAEVYPWKYDLPDEHIKKLANSLPFTQKSC